MSHTPSLTHIIYTLPHPYHIPSLSPGGDPQGRDAKAGAVWPSPVPCTPSLTRTPRPAMQTDHKVTKQMLEREGHTVALAENGNQSLELLKAEYGEYDMLITGALGLG